MDRSRVVDAKPATPPRSFTIALWAIAIGWAILQRPFGFGLQPYLFFDSGWALTTDELLRDGLVPTCDFAYFYGLLTLVVDRAWFAVFGATPFAQGGLCLVCAAAATHAVWRFAAAAALGFGARGLLLACAPLAIMPSFYSTPVHALEHALLINALAYQAKGRLPISLALATVALFVKPALAAVYGLILLGFILFGRRDPEVKILRRLRDLIPAAVTGLGVTCMLVANFGIEPLVATLVPLEAAKLYAAENYGFFFGIGRNFWLPIGPEATYYPLRPGPFWVAGTIILTWRAARDLRKERTPLTWLASTCVALHLAFTCLFFGNAYSWQYYPYPLIFGLCLVLNRGAPADRGTILGVGALAILGQSLVFLMTLAMLLRSAAAPGEERSAATSGLLASREDQESWTRVRALAVADTVLVLSNVGAAHAVMPEVASPRSWFLLRPVARPAEIERLRDQLASANWLVIPTGPGDKLTTWPELADQLRNFQIVEEHASFVLARRIRPAPR